MKRILCLLATVVPTVLLIVISSTVFANSNPIATVSGTGESFTITLEGGNGTEQIEAYTPNQLVFTPTWTLVTSGTYQAIISDTIAWDSFTLFWVDQTWVDEHPTWEVHENGFMVRTQTPPPPPQPSVITATVEGSGESFTITVQGGTGTEQIEAYTPNQLVFTPTWTMVTTGTYQAVITDTTGWDSFTLFWLDQIWVDEHHTWEAHENGFMVRSPITEPTEWTLYLPLIHK